MTLQWVAAKGSAGEFAMKGAGATAQFYLAPRKKPMT
jgi:hypothetical protein